MKAKPDWLPTRPNEGCGGGCGWVGGVDELDCGGSWGESENAGGVSGTRGEGGEEMGGEGGVGGGVDGRAGGGSVISGSESTSGMAVVPYKER